MALLSLSKGLRGFSNATANILVVGQSQRAALSGLVDERADWSAELLAAKRRQAGLTFAEIAQRLGVGRVWLTAAMLGQHKFTAAEAAALLSVLKLERDPRRAEMIRVLQASPVRYGHDEYEDDPTVYRLQELVKIYGPSIKLLIDEEFGDGIMSAVDCTIELEKKTIPDSGEERVVLRIDGKFLKYRKW